MHDAANLRKGSVGVDEMMVFVRCGNFPSVGIAAEDATPEAALKEDQVPKSGTVHRRHRLDRMDHASDAPGGHGCRRRHD